MTEIIAELGINHNGDMTIVKKLIDVAYTAGCDYVKLQTRKIDCVYTKDELDTPRQSPWGTTTRQQKEGIELDPSDYGEINEYCKGRIGWFSSPWDIVSMDFLASFNTPFIKIASAKITNEGLITAKSPKQKFIISTGGSTFEQIDRAIELIGQDRIYCILHCTSTYPTKPEEINMQAMLTLRQRYPWTKIGFSNHYPGLRAMEMAATMGVDMIEFHLTLDRTMYGSDQAASIEPRGLFEFMEKLKLTKEMMGDGIKRVYDSEVPIMKKLRR
jgi:N-acetylneuraminate synthase